ncbi:hypothetical protein B0H21DRAFT_500853 [Amylocystis lapponica]|nr:hypothetical protein B0H21DRAFT_500853 [Amylocystis lapponica]
MSTSFPFPLSHHRSHYGQDQVQFRTDPLAYSHEQYLSRPPSYDGHVRIGVFHAESAALDMYQVHPALRLPSGTHYGNISDSSCDSLQSQKHVHDAPSAQSSSNLSPIDNSAFDMPFSRDAYSYQDETDAASSFAQSSAEGAPQQSDISLERVSPLMSSSTKSRREKNRIELAPDQPLTTQGKPRTRVYVACVQCRSRKIRCDGAKPLCHNCSRRPNLGSQCSYDSVPKRRGPDKMPGARQRTAGGGEPDGDQPRRRTRRRVEEESSAREQQIEHGAAPSFVEATLVPPAPERAIEYSSNIATGGNHARDLSPPSPRPSHGSSFGSSPNQSMLPLDPPGPHEPPGRESLVSQVRYETNGIDTYDNHRIVTYVQSYLPHHGHPNVADVRNNRHERSHLPLTIASEPSVRFSREIWWDALLSLYSSHDSTSVRLTPVPTKSRELISQRIVADLRFLFRCSSHWMSFINIPRFFARLRDRANRSSVQPSLILAALALATFLRSSEQEQGVRGRDRALKLRDEAQNALEASVNARWIDESLVQASWVLAFFEVCAHPLHSAERVCSSLSMLDSLIRSLSLTKVDADDKRVSIFTPRAVPTVPQPAGMGAPRRECWDTHEHGDPQRTPRKCTCSMYTLGEASPRAVEVTPLWSATPAWNNDWSEGEVQMEECRRVIWSTVMLVAGYTSYATAMDATSMLDLSIMDPANFAVLFPGESLIPSRGDYGTPKESVWALYMRTLLLWNSCVRMRQDTTLNHLERAQFAVKAWLEIEIIEDAARQHTCNIERTFIFASREYLSNTRMFIYDEIKRYVPQATANANIVHRRKAEEWLTHQTSVAKSAMLGLHMVTGQPTSDLTDRPSYIFWFTAQISRILKLWSTDNTLLVALDAAKALLVLLEQLTALWPCPEPQRKTQELRSRVTAFCCASGVIPPPD